MRIVLSLAVFLTSLLSFEIMAQVPDRRKDLDEMSLYNLTGTVEKYSVEENKTSGYVSLTVDFELVNISDRKIILWKRDEKDFQVEPKFGGKATSRTPFFRDGDLIEDHYGGPSFDYQDKWARLGKRLMRRVLPKW